MRYEISVEIEAAPERVWAALIDVERWPDWTASMTGLRLVTFPPLATGSEVLVRQPRLPATRWRVTRLEPERMFTWQADRRGLTTVAAHRMAVLPGGSVKLTLAVAQIGALAPVLGAMTAGLTRRYVTMEAYGLKRYCEAA